ncbi:MAG: glycosyltransferase family 39 protein [Blastocatellia bacterium]|nr:glycosyltransferase family 39 protein [Blastocatellia bacterium]
MIRSGKLVFLFTFFALLVQSLFFFADKPDEFLAIPLTLILGGAAAYFIGKDANLEDAEFQVNIFLLAFSIRIWAGLALYGWGLSGVFGDEDASEYISGWRVAENWYRNGFDGFISDLSRVIFEKTNIGQSVIWGIPMFIAGGPSRMIVSVINSFAGSLLVIVIYRMSRRIFGSQTARISAILAAFWASFLLLSAGTLKEMLVILFEWTVLYLAVRNPKGLSVSDGLLAIPALLALYVTRFYALYIVAAAFLFRIIITGRRNLIRNAVLGVIVVGSVMIVLNAGGVINRDFERLERQNEVIDSWRTDVAESTGSGTGIYAEFEGSSVAIPVATLYFLFAPFPWEFFSGTPRNSFAVVENLAIIIILIIGFPALKIFFKDKLFEIAPILVFCVLYAGMHIWGLANIGLAWRHKQTIMPMFFMLVALGITHRKQGLQIIGQKLTRKQNSLRVYKTT